MAQRLVTLFLLSIIALLVFTFISFFKLAKRNYKNKWLYSIGSIFSFFGILFFVVCSVDLIRLLFFFGSNPNSQIESFFGIFLAFFLNYKFYKYLIKKWESNDISQNEIKNIGKNTEY